MIWIFKFYFFMLVEWVVILIVEKCEELEKIIILYYKEFFF